MKLLCFTAKTTGLLVLCLATPVAQSQQLSVAAPPQPVYQPPSSQPASMAGSGGGMGSAMPQQPTSSAPSFVADPSKVLGAGDQVTFSIVEDRDPPLALRVTDTGELDIPYIGRVSVSGKTSADASAEIKRRLESKFYYSATVRLGIDQVNLASSVAKIYVSGLVTVPGPQDIYAGEKLTVSNVIVRAGGLKPFADGRRVRVTRRGKNGQTESRDVDVKAVLEKGDLSKDMPLQGGDYVNVPQKLINW